MSDDRKYSKISSALKHYFLNNLYYHCLEIRQAAEKCRINYSTAKIILRELSPEEKRFIKRLIRQKQKDEREGMDRLEQCQYRQLGGQPPKRVEVISRVGFNYFAPLDKK